MTVYKETIIRNDLPFPVDVFIQDNLRNNIIVPTHWHDCIEILYMIEGSAMQQVNNRYFKVGRHDIIILNVGDIHSTSCIEGEDVKILVIKFLPDILNSAYSRTFESKYILSFLQSKFNQVYHIEDTVKNSSEVYNLMIGIYDEFIKKENGFEIFIKGYIYQLIAYFIRNDILNSYNNAFKEELIKFDRLFKHIENHYKDDINLKDAADMLNLSYFYFSRYFKKITGQSFKRYIDFVRICEAEKILLTKNISISQAAYEVGFSNVSSFNRVFKRIRGHNPSSIKSKNCKEISKK